MRKTQHVKSSETARVCDSWLSSQPSTALFRPEGADTAMPTGLPKVVPPAVLQSEMRYGWGGLAIPPMLAERRLPVNPTGRLDMEEHRFLPRDDTELLASIFTWWNLLDGVMLQHEPQSRYGCAGGAMLCCIVKGRATG